MKKRPIYCSLDIQKVRNAEGSKVGANTEVNSSVSELN